MPTAIRRACSTFGCPNTQPCARHGRVAQTKVYDDRRGSAASRGYGSKWARYRRWYFSELVRLARIGVIDSAGLCGARFPDAPQTRDSQCRAAKRAVVATVVDHIVPVTGQDDPRFFDPSGQQALCDPCHQAKRQREALASRIEIARATGGYPDVKRP